jgi:hypothetical protein
MPLKKQCRFAPRHAASRWPFCRRSCDVDGGAVTTNRLGSRALGVNGLAKSPLGSKAKLFLDLGDGRTPTQGFKCELKIDEKKMHPVLKS